MFKELFNEHIIFTTLFLFIVAYIVMNLESIKKGVYITPNYINPLLISLASVVVLKLIFCIILIIQIKIKFYIKYFI